MSITIGNERLSVTLNEKKQKELQQLRQKCGESESKIVCIVLDLLIAQKKTGFDIPALRKRRHFSSEETKVITLNRSCYLEYFLCPFYSILY